MACLDDARLSTGGAGPDDHVSSCPSCTARLQALELLRVALGSESDSHGRERLQREARTGKLACSSPSAGIT